MDEQEQDMDEDDEEPRYECNICHDRGRIAAMNGQDEYLGDGEIPCPFCMKGWMK